MDFLFPFLLALIFGIVTWCVASEGAWGAALTFLCVLFAGLLAMNFFEPVAAFIERSGGNFFIRYADVIALVGLFALFTFLGRAVTEQLSKIDIEMDARAYQFGRWLFAAATGYTTMAFLLTALHTAPLPREFIGFRPEADNFFDVDAPDRRWLGFVQYVSEHVLYRGRIFDGPVGDVPGANPPRTDIWPSFPIRYATRRADLASGIVKKASSSPAPTAPAAIPGAPATKPQF
jgi:hypothetical protein